MTSYYCGLICIYKTRGIFQAAYSLYSVYSSSDLSIYGRSVTKSMASNNSSDNSYLVSSYLAVNAVSLILFVLPGLILNGLVAVALAGEITKKQQGRAQWIILLNISLAGLVTTLSLGALSVSRLFLVNNVQEGAAWLCRIGFSAVHISISIRTASLALLSVVVYIIIKHGLSKVKLAPLIVSVAILWLVVVLTGLGYWTPAYHFEPFRDGILACDATFTSSAYAHISLSILIVDIPGRLISVCTIIAAVVHIKRRTVTDYNPIKRSFLRFSIILLCINILILITNVVGTVGFIFAVGAHNSVLIWLTLAVYVAIFLPAIVVPVLMMILFKPIWFAVKGVLACKMFRAWARGGAICCAGKSSIPFP